MQRFTKRWEEKNSPCRIFWVAEPFDLKEGFHLHALFAYKPVKGQNWKRPTTTKNGNKIMLDVALVNCTWEGVSGKGNRSTVLRYDKRKGARYYCGKYLMKNLSDYDFVGFDKKI